MKRSRKKVWRWSALSEREKQLCRLRVVEDMKIPALALEVGISAKAVEQNFYAIYHVLNVSGRVQLAFEMGKHWKEISNGNGSR
jgi:DNA-binding CsgD family transcriptional regulator